MRAQLFAALTVFAISPFAFAADEENPYKKVKVGEYATYKMTTKIAGMNLEGTLTQKCTAKTDKEATIKVEVNINGMEIPAQEQKIDLTKPYDPTKAAFPDGTDAKLEKLKDGKEKIKVGGKEIECKWESYKVKIKANDMEVDAEIKIWTSNDITLFMAKMEMTADVAGMKLEMEMEFSESGTKKE